MPVLWVALHILFVYIIMEHTLPYYRVCTVHFPIVQYTLYTSPFYSIHCALPCCTVYTVHYTVFTLYRMHTVQWYNVQCTLAHCSVFPYCMHCTTWVGQLSEAARRSSVQYSLHQCSEHHQTLYKAKPHRFPLWFGPPFFDIRLSPFLEETIYFIGAAICSEL